MLGWYAYARARVKIEDSQLSKVQRFRNPLILVFFAYAFALLIWLAVLLRAATDLWDYGLVSLFLFFTVVEVFLGGVFLFRRGIKEGSWEAARGSLYLGLAVVYLGSVAAGVCLAGLLQRPALPTMELTRDGPNGTEQVDTVGILSNSNGYWYAVNYCENYKFLAVPNKKVEEVDTIVDEPSTLETLPSKNACDTTKPKTNIKSGPSDPSKNNTPTFTFGGKDNLTKKVNLLFSYKVDNDKWSDYQSDNTAPPRGARGLDDGSHTFSVRAKDDAGNVDDDPDRYTWTIC
jgi:Bacterial Ig-like domain